MLKAGLKKTKKLPLMKPDFISSSQEETEGLGTKLANGLSPSSVLAIQGDLGAGKTTLIKGLAAKLTNVDPANVNSPTFNYLNIYQGPITLYHFDLYRLKDEKDFFKMGFLEFLSGGVCCIEWPERILKILPKETIWVHLKYQNDQKRHITIKNFHGIN